MLLATWSCLALAAPLPVAEASVVGTYTNVVPDVTLFTDYVEICFVATFGKTLVDLHPGGGATIAGNCVPGMPGYLLELIPRAKARWVNARAECLSEGMRLPEVFELLHACENPAKLGFASLQDTGGWASNNFFMIDQSSILYTHTVAPLAPSDCRPQQIDIADKAPFICAL